MRPKPPDTLLQTLYRAYSQTNAKSIARIAQKKATIAYFYRIILPKIALTPNEYRILELFLHNPRRIFDRSTIIDRVWTMEETPTEKAVNTHIKNLRSKLGQAGIIEDPIETVHGLGYRLKYLPTNISC